MILGELTSTALTLCHEKQIRVRCITFDGAASNFASIRYLRAKRAENDDRELDEDAISEDEEEDLGIEEPYEYQNHFHHPPTGKKVYSNLCPSHMLKLARNALGELFILTM